MLGRVLERIGLSDKYVRIIRSMYVNTSAKYSIGEIETGWVRSRRGVRQGCILSPLLFSLYTEELAKRLREQGGGVRVGNDKLKIVLYADDAVVMSETAEELQGMMDCVSGYGRDFDVKFSAEKSQVLVVNGTDEDVDRKWVLGGKEIGRTNEYRYLGMNVNEKGCDGTKDIKVSKANQWLGILGSAIKVRACKYEVVREVWKSVSVPSVMYGMEVLAWTEGEVDKLDAIQNKVARMALGAPRWAAVEALRGDMGWSTFRERRMKGVLRYKVRLERMSSERWARKVYMWNMRVSKWEKKCYAMVYKCSLPVRWSHQLPGRERGEWLMTVGEGVGVEWDRKEWYAEINRRVKEMGLDAWRKGIIEKDTLQWYSRKKEPHYECLYDGSRGGDLMFGVRSKSLGVNARTYRWNERREKECFMCDKNETETVEHLMLECEAYEVERIDMMNDVLEELGENDGQMYERTAEDWICIIVGLNEDRQKRAVEGGKRYLEKVWKKRECRRRVRDANRGVE